MESLHNPLHSTNLRNLHLQSLHNPFHFTIHCTSQSQFTIHNHTSQFTITRGLCGEKRPLRSVSHTLLGAFAQVVDLSESLDPVLNERRWAASGDLDKRRPRPRKLASPDERRWTTSGADVERRPRPRKLASDKRRWASLGATSEDLDERCPKSRKLASPIGFITIMLLVKRFRESPACSQSANLDLLPDLLRSSVTGA